MDNVQKINIYKSPSSESFRCILKNCYVLKKVVNIVHNKCCVLNSYNTPYFYMTVYGFFSFHLEMSVNYSD
jgi:hypothetical protein